MGDDVRRKQKVMEELFCRVHELGNAREWIQMDAMLRETHVGEHDDIYLTSLLRASYPVRSLLSSWESFRIRVWLELERRGSDPVRLLRGLGDRPTKSKE